MITLTNVEKKYDQNIILNKININIKKGDIFGLIGTSGAGKSTVLKIINGLESIDQGIVTVDNVDVSALNSIDKRLFQKRIGMIFQNFALLERKSVFENVAFPLRCAKYSKEYINNKVEYLLKKVGIIEKKDAMPSQLSGGQRQRVAIARALSLEPDILLCDEATSGLDPQTTITILDLLKDINKKDNITIVLVTHEMDVVQRICDSVALIEEGVIKTSGIVEDVLPTYFNSYQMNKDDYSTSDILLRLQYTNSKSNNNILTKIVLDNNLSFSIEDSQTQYLKNSTITSFILKIKNNDYVILDRYLTENNIQYSLVKGIGAHTNDTSE